MRASARKLIPAFVLVLFALVVADVHKGFALLDTTSVVLCLLGGALLLVTVRRVLAWPHQRAATALTVGALAALALGAVSFEAVLRRSDREWNAIQERNRDRIAARIEARFRELSRSARDAARALGRSSALALAVEGSDYHDYVARAFNTLARFPLPHAHPRGRPGTTLYDVLQRPIAWSGDNVALDTLLAEINGVPEPGVFVIERGVYTYLVALEPLPGGRGFVTVEIPLIADRRLQNRYLDDYDALSFWVDRSVTTEFVNFGDDPEALEARLEQEGDRFWAGTEDAPRLYFSLRTDEGQLLGLSSVAGESPVIARREAGRGYQLAAGICLVIASVIALVLFIADVSNPWARVVALWGTRFVVLSTNFPLSFGLEVDNPAHYGSSLLFGLVRSPIDFLLTTATLTASLLLVFRAFDSWTPPGRARFPFAVAASAASLGAFLATNEIILDAWLNSNLALSTVSLFPFDAPRLTLQLGLVLLFLSAGIFAFMVLSRASVAAPKSVVIDGAVITTFYVLSARSELAGHVLLALPPFVLVRLLALNRDKLGRRWLGSGLYVRLATAGFVTLATIVSFYPAIAAFEERTVRHFVEFTVAPIVRQHSRSSAYTLVETASAIDRMIAEGHLDIFDGGEDVAYRIWVATDLGASSLSSSIEILDEDGQIVSRFALSFPAMPGEKPRAPAPREWIVETESIPEDSSHPGILMTRRAIESPDGIPWEIRVRLAADWRNLPFITTTNPYLYLFRTSGVDASFRFPYRELSLQVLEPDGTPVFQSTGDALRPAEELLKEARGGPVWWVYARDEQLHHAYLFNDGTHTFVLSYVKTAPVTYASQLAAWAVLGGGVLVAVLMIALGVGTLGGDYGVSTEELWARVGTSFRGKLYVAFVLIALVPIGSLAFLVRGIVIRQLNRDIEREGIAHARVVKELVDDFVHFRGLPTKDDGGVPVTDAVLERVGSLAAVDVDLYAGGQLVATSKAELFDSGLLRSRAAPTAYRELVLERLTHSIHRESVGSFEYLVVSVPIFIEPWMEPTILSLPLASHKSDIERRISLLNQTLLLAALGFSLAAAALAYTLARRIAEPINTLTDATHRIAEGDLDVSLETTSKDEIGELVASFTQMTADLKRQRSDLERTKKLEAWAEMARQVAHEVKNPLTPIQLSAEHLLRVYRDPNVDFEQVLDECTATILQQVKTLRQISLEFSTFASPEPLNPEPTDIEELVREAIEPYLQTPPDGVTVDLRITDGLPMLHADGRLLKRTLLNLMENALHALNGDGTVTVGVGCHHVNGTRFVEVSVADTGVGIEPALQQRIFEPYFSTRAAGTGLGLAIAKKVVEEHGGEILLESEPGRGTTVRLRLPVRGDS